MLHAIEELLCQQQQQQNTIILLDRFGGAVFRTVPRRGSPLPPNTRRRTMTGTPLHASSRASLGAPHEYS